MLNAEQFLFSTRSHAASDDTRPKIFLQMTKKAKKKEVNSKKYGGSFKCTVPFQSEWKVNFLIKEGYNDKCKFHCLPCGKSISCYHQSLRDVRVHCSTSAYKTNVKSRNKQDKIYSTRLISILHLIFLSKKGY